MPPATATLILPTRISCAAEAIACAKKILQLPQQAVEATKRLMNLQLEKSVMASLDYANLAEYVSFGTADFNKIVDGLIAKQ